MIPSTRVCRSYTGNILPDIPEACLHPDFFCRSASDPEGVLKQLDLEVLRMFRRAGHRHHIEAEGPVVDVVAGDKAEGGAGDFRLLSGRQRRQGMAEGASGAGFHFDEGEDGAVLGDDVDLADGVAEISCAGCGSLFS